MALSTTSGHSDERRRQHHHESTRKKKQPPAAAAAPQPPPQTRAMAGSKNRSSKKPPAAASAAAAAPSGWEQLKGLLSCRSAAAAARVHDPAASSALARLRSAAAGQGAACGASLCAMRDVVDTASSTASAAAASDRDTAPLTRASRRAHHAAAAAGPHGGQPSLRGLSGCYECRAINVEPMSRRYPRARELCSCSECGDVFTKAESLEQHQIIRHAVSELGPEDSGRSIVEIIFKSSWQKPDRPICQIDRILKVRNPARTLARFEAYRDSVKTRSRAAAARAAADGNELLRFHSAPLACPLGLHGSASLCAASGPRHGGAAADSAAGCGVCTAIRHGFAPLLGAHPLGVRTTASSGRAHDHGDAAAGRRAMLVCRVIAGRVRRPGDSAEEAFDSVAGDGGVCGNLEELFVANPRAILPCFVVIYRALD